MSIELVMLFNHLIFCRPVLLLSSVFFSIRILSNELALGIRWPKYWSFDFSISPSNEYSRLIFFRMDWFDLFAVQRTLKSFPVLQFKNIFSSALNLLYGPTLTVMCFPGGASGKESACQYRRCGSHGFDPWVREIHGGGNGYPLQYSCLENSMDMDRGAWQATVHVVLKSQTWLSHWHFHFSSLTRDQTCTLCSGSTKS